MKKIFKIYISLFLISWLCLPQLVAQEILNGRVINSEGKSIKEATVSIVGKGITTTTDKNGYFNISVQDDELLMVEAGMQSQTYKMKKNKASYVLKNYHESVNWGLGNVKQQAQNTAAISTVYSDMLSNNSVINPENALYGQLAGLTVLQNGGTPWGRNPDIYVRGIGTLNDKAVLVLVDGIERPMSSLVIDDIESISVLKDAAALAIYGQRGANGAIVVSTKRGEYESFSVDASYQYGLSTASQLPKMLDAYGYAQAVNEARTLDGNAIIYSSEDLSRYKSGDQPYYYPNVDWLNEVLNDYGISTDFNARFRGGGKNVRYFSSINYQTESGLFNNTDQDSRYDSQLKYTRFNVRANVDADITSTTLVSVNINASMSDRKYPGAGVSNIMKATYNTPSAAYPVKTNNGVWGGTDIYDNNPVAMIAATGYRQDFHRELLGDVTIQQDLDKVVKGLSAEITAGFDNSAIYWEGKKKTYEYENIDLVRDANTGVITDSISNIYGLESDLEDYDSNHNDLTQWRRATFRAKLNYNKTWEQSVLSSSLLYTQDKYVEDSQYHTWLRQNIAGHAHYGLKNKYLADVTLSYAGSSNLADNDRFGFFPALSAGWVISEEDFLRTESLDYLKLRVSWGMTGSDLMTQNLYDQQFTNGDSYYFGQNYSGSTGMKAGRLATSGLSYETSVKTNIGVDMQLFKKLNVTVDAFYDKRKDILVDSEGVVSDVVGVTSSYQNIGEVENRGIETSLKWQQKIGAIQYYLGGNFSFVRNKIVQQNETYRPYGYQRRTGQPVEQMFGLEAVGFFEDEADIANSSVQQFSEVRPGDIKYKDQNNDHVIDSYDEIAMGYSSLVPEIYYGFNLGFEIKGFGVDAVFQGIANQTIYLNTPSIFFPLMDNTNISEFSNQRWTPQNMEDATLPRLSMEGNENNYRKNSIWLQDGDYLKLRSLNVYYNLPQRIIQKFKLSKATVFARGMNLFSIDKIDGMDPEDISMSYPTLSSYHLGVTIGF